MPRRLVCVGPRRLEWQEYEAPEVSGDQVRVESEFAAPKHGTEMACYKGYMFARGHFDAEYQAWMPGAEGWCGFPLGVGNMIVGRVVAVGPDAKQLAPGNRVCFHHGFQPVSVLPERSCRKMPDGLSWQSAVCVDPAEFAFAAVRDGHVRIGDAVAIFGMGAIGLMAVQLARLAGADPVIAVEPLENRRRAAAAVGASLTLDPFACDAGLEIKKTTLNRGADVVIDYSGDMKAIQDALRGVAYGGNVVAGAMPAPYGGGLDLGAEAHFNVPNIIFSRACSQPGRDHPRWNEGRIAAACWKLLCHGRITGDPIVQPIVPFEDLLREYPRIETDPDKNIKLGVKF